MCPRGGKATGCRDQGRFWFGVISELAVRENKSSTIVNFRFDICYSKSLVLYHYCHHPICFCMFFSAFLAIIGYSKDLERLKWEMSLLKD